MEGPVQILQIILGIFFIMMGLPKLMGVKMMVDNFTKWGYPSWFRYVVGIVEILAGAVLLIGAFAEELESLVPIAAIALVIDMLGAIFTHIRAREMKMLPMPLIAGIIAVFVFAFHANIISG